MIGDVLRSGISESFCSSKVKVLPINSMLNLVLKHGLGIVFNNAMCASMSVNVICIFLIQFSLVSFLAGFG